MLDLIFAAGRWLIIVSASFKPAQEPVPARRRGYNLRLGSSFAYSFAFGRNSWTKGVAYCSILELARIYTEPMVSLDHY